MGENTGCAISGCVSCGGTVAPDGHCWDCGTAQPDFRARLEVTGAGGAAGISDRGRRRGVNADALALTTSGMWTIGVVCDGVSMAPRAERAAQVAAEVGAAATAALLGDGILPELALAEAAVRAGKAVAALAGSPVPALSSPESLAPACTYVAGIVGPEGIWTAGVGDSRAYWLPDDGPGFPMTDDATAELGVLTAWLGADAGEPAPHVRSYRPRELGRLLLCSDGLWRYLPTAEALRAVADGPRTDDPAGRGGGGPALADVRALIDHAIASGGHDNVTALVLPVAPASTS
ncbi:MAG: protein serine/threonine phosphatase 2C family protein [Streptomycetaceae bacterium]|nr:protein serine/threonine phosphatase 2C family protein [Streptomycetaceae bacterium]